MPPFTIADFLICSSILLVILGMMRFAYWADKKNGAEGLIMIESTSVSHTMSRIEAWRDVDNDPEFNEED